MEQHRHSESSQKELLQKPMLTLQNTEAVLSRKPLSWLTSIWLGSFSMPWGLTPAMGNDQDSQQHSSISPSAELQAARAGRKCSAQSSPAASRWLVSRSSCQQD